MLKKSNLNKTLFFTLISAIFIASSSYVLVASAAVQKPAATQYFNKPHSRSVVQPEVLGVSVVNAYVDSLTSPWINASWSSTNNFKSTENAYSGAVSIKSSMRAWGALSIHDGPWNKGTDIGSGKYDNLSFAVNGGTVGLNLNVRLENDKRQSFPVTKIGLIPANTWRVITLPFSQLNPNKQLAHRLDFINNSAKSAVAYVDSISLNSLGVLNDVTPPSIQISISPTAPTLSQLVIITSTATDASGISSVSITLDGVVVASCSTSPCSVIVGPYTTGSVHSYYATAVDASTNKNAATSTKMSFIISGPSSDVISPTVSLTSPTNGTTVSGTINLSATATDNIGVAGVQFKVDGTILGTEDTTYPYSVSLNTTTISNGSHTITATARDGANNSAVSGAVTITVSNTAVDTIKPTVSISSPISGTTVSGVITLSATATDNIGVVGVQFKVDGTNSGVEDTTSPYSISLNTTALTNGSHIITAVARDAAGNSTTSLGSTVTVSNIIIDPTAPIVSITAPSNGVTVSGTITISANASDNIGVVGVQFKVNGSNYGPEDTAYPYSVSFDTTVFSNGSYALTALARDAANNQTTSTAVTVTISNSIGKIGNFKIMALGDSITGTTCYQPFVMVDLKNGGYTNWSYVGTLITTDGKGTTCAGVPYYLPTEGHSGYNSSQIAAGLPSWLTQTKPDIVYMHVGTNNFWNGATTAQISSTLADYSTMVDAMRASNPSVKILVAQIIPMNSSTASAAAVNALDDQIPTWASSKTTAQSPIYVVDLRTGFDVNNYYSDAAKVHPNEAGSKWMADKMYAVLSPLLVSNGGSDTTAPTVQISINPTAPNSSQTVLYTATASDTSGISSLTIKIDNTVVATCTTSPCTYTSGPYAVGSTHTYLATAVDASTNKNTTTTTAASFSVSTNTNPTYQLYYSMSADRSSPKLLSGVSLPGNTDVYIFLEPQSGPSSVTFNLDNGVLVHPELTAPWDFNNGAPAAAYPWNTGIAANHQITSAIATSSGIVTMVTNFSVSAPIDITGPNVQISTAPYSPTPSQTVVYTATASDMSGISSLTITVDGRVVATCVTSPCTYTSGPYVDGSTHTYSATAVDNSTNKNTATSALLSFTVSPTPIVNGKWVVAYYAGWQQTYLPASAIDYSTVTHIVYFAAVPNANGTLNLSANGVTNNTNQVDLITRAHAAGVKVIFTVGGWNTEAAFNGATSNATTRATFISNLVNAMQAGNYDGLDIDWERLDLGAYPNELNNYVTFSRELRTAMTAAKPGSLLTMATQWEASISAAAAPYYDQINLMTYDLSGVWEGWVSWHNAAIYDGGIKFPQTTKLVPSANGMIDSWIAAGVPKEKLGIGIDWYGYKYSGVTGPNMGWTSTKTNPSETLIQGNRPYSDIMKSDAPTMTKVWDPVAQASYLTNSSGWVSFDDEDTIRAKAAYVQSKGIGGAIIWELGGGYRSSMPAGQRDILLQTIKTAFGR